MNKKLIVASMPVHDQECIATVLYENQTAVECALCRREEERILGNIYVGKVEKIQPNVNGAFVLIQPGVTGYLSLQDCKNAILKTRKKTEDLKPGDELLVQVGKEALKQKLPRLTTNLTISGKFFVLSTGRRSLNFSGKLSSEEKQRLKSLLSFKPDTYGMIVRTNAQEASEEELKTEFQMLKDRIDRICQYGTARTCFSCLWQEPGEWIAELKQHSFQTLTQILTDDANIYDEIAAYLDQTDAKGQVTLKLYQDALLPLYKLYNLTTLTERLRQEKIWLKSGGFLVIQQTEAFVVIDVNTGKYVGKKNADETFYQINREAAEEIAIQLRLRQLSGIILIDFINMSQPNWQADLLEYMQDLVNRDSVKTRVVDMTPLHIMELTRQKEKKSFQEQWQAILRKETHTDEI